MRAVWPWSLRLVWLAVPFATGPVLAEALEGRSGSVQTTASVALWAVWAIVLVAALLPRTTSLTIVRIAAPGALAVCGWAALETGVDDVAAAAGLTATAVATVVAMTPAVGDEFVNGSAYGPERRFALRVPAPLVFGPIPIAWALTVAGAVTGPLLLAAGRWVLGGAATLLGVAVVAFGVRSLHTLARRWLVFVPGGVVLHDPLAAAESVLMPRGMIDTIGPAAAVEGGLDLTQRAAGLALEVRLNELLAVSLYQPLSRSVESVDTDRVLFAPTKPAAVLDVAAERGIRVG